MLYPWKPDKARSGLKAFSLSAADKTITLNSAEADFENKKYSISGRASLAQERLSMDFDVKTDIIELDKILETFQGKVEEPEEEEQRVGKSWDLAVEWQHQNPCRFPAVQWLYLETFRITYYL